MMHSSDPVLTPFGFSNSGWMRGLGAIKCRAGTATSYTHDMQNGHRESNGNVKEQARMIINRLASDATWDDLMHQIYVRLAIESGLADSEAGRTVPVNEVRAGLGLSA